MLLAEPVVLQAITALRAILVLLGAQELLEQVERQLLPEWRAPQVLLVNQVAQRLPVQQVLMAREELAERAHLRVLQQPMA